MWCISTPIPRYIKMKNYQVTHFLSNKKIACLKINLMGKSEPDQDPSEAWQYVFTHSVASNWSKKESSRHEATGMWSPVTTLPTKKKKIARSHQAERIYTLLRVSSDTNPWPKPKIWGFPLLFVACPNVLTKYGLRPTVKLKKFKVQQSC
jgi:hypothetical protein